MKAPNNKKSKCVRVPFSNVRRLPIILMAATLVLAFSIGSASSFGPQNLELNATGKHYIKPLLSVEHACRSLLNPIQKTSSYAPADKDQRKAGKLVALGVLLGARFALEPKDAEPESYSVQSAAHKPYLKDTTTGSIVQYRQCIKKEALATLSRQSEDG